MTCTVLSATYDGERADRLDRYFASIAAQTLQPEQIVLVLDGPVRDALRAIIDRWSADLPVEAIDAPKGGAAASLNRGLALCRSEVIVRCDTDDINRPERFATQVAALADPAVAMASGPIREFTETGDEAVRTVPLGRLGPNTLYSFFRNPVNGNNFAVRRSALVAVGGYPAGRMEDYRMALALLAAGHAIENHPEILLDASVDNLVSRRMGPTYRAAEWALWRQNARRIGGLGVLPATLALGMRLPFRWEFARSSLGFMYRKVLR